MAIIEKTIEIEIKDNKPPRVEDIERQIEKEGLDVVRWAIVNVKDNKYVIAANGIVKKPE